MRFTLTIDCDNDAFGRDPELEVARLLHLTAKRLYDGEGKLHDANGNTVGRFQFIDQE